MWALGLGDFEQAVETAFAEDLAAGDLTAAATVPPGHRARALIRAKADLVVCGLAVARHCFCRLDPESSWNASVEDGESVSAGTTVATIEGNARALLGAERTALNFMQRLSGIATLTRHFVAAAGGHTRIVDTRKTTPGLRSLERHAVRCGGGHNHRNDLGSAVLIKENHIRCAGGVAAAIQAARAHAPHTSKIECEVTTLDELAEALEAQADIVMLDNMDDPTVKKALEQVRGAAVVEVSGGITLERVASLAALGVDVISVGALTHSAPSADLSMLIEVEP